MYLATLRSGPALAAAALSLLVFACDTGGGDSQPDGGGGGGDGGMVSPSCMEAEQHADLAWLQENIFTPGCANFSSCHQGEALSAGGLNLEDGMTETNLVNVESQIVNDLGMGPMDLVEPGDCAQSYLIVIMEGMPSNLIDSSVGTMPYGNPRLCSQKIDAVCRWIESL